jgi:hypothetical protein
MQGLIGTRTGKRLVLLGLMACLMLGGGRLAASLVA